MPEKTKKHVGWALIIALLLFGWSTIRYTGAYRDSVDLSTVRTFSVSGEGSEVSIPDVALFTAGVTTEGGKDISVIQKDNTEKMNKIIAFIKSKKVDAKDIKTEQYSLEPRYQYSNCFRNGPDTGAPSVCPPPQIVGYTISQTISVKIRNFELIGDILSGTLSAGANTVSQLSFTVDDPTSLENKAREGAIREAKEKAHAIARAGGFRLGRIVSLQESGATPPYFRYAAKTEAMSAYAADAMPVPTIEPGSQKITASVTIQYEIQ